jgi:hypothetical protein
VDTGLKGYKPWLCPNKHDKNVEGVTGPSQRCKKCKREANRKWQARLRERLKQGENIYTEPSICPNNHDKSVVGVASNGRCKKCKAEADAAYMKGWQERKRAIERGELVALTSLKTIREELGMSPERMAGYCGMYSETLLKVEDGTVLANKKLQDQILRGVVLARRAVLREKKRQGRSM